MHQSRCTQGGSFAGRWSPAQRTFVGALIFPGTGYERQSPSRWRDTSAPALCCTNTLSFPSRSLLAIASSLHRSVFENRESMTHRRSSPSTAFVINRTSLTNSPTILKNRINVLFLRNVRFTLYVVTLN